MKTETSHDLVDRLATALGSRPARVKSVHANYGFTVYRVETQSGVYAAKTGRGAVDDHLAIEAGMLRDLGREASLRVPHVVHAEGDLLVMEWIESDGGPVRECHERAAGEALARLHATPRGRFGYAYDTTIGALTQPNPGHDTWCGFFGEARLTRFAEMAHARGHVSAELRLRIERLADRIEDYLPEPVCPALVHGDLWSGNVLTNGDEISGYIDPALYHASPEVELAYVTMLGTFGAQFFEAYAANADIAPGFADRIDILNVYPNLVHVMLCGPAYILPIERALSRLGL